MCIDLRVSAQPPLAGGLARDAKRRGDARPGDAGSHEPIDLRVDGVLRPPKLLDKICQRRRQSGARNGHGGGLRIPPLRRRRRKSQAGR